MKKGIVVAFVVLGIVAGCSVGTDPATGAKTYAVDPNSKALAGAEAAVETVGTIAPLVGGATGGIIGGVALGILAAWRKVKPALTAARTEASLYHAAAASTVTALETYKETSPETWTKLGELLTVEMGKHGVDAKIIENVIRGLRGLPEKA